MQRFRRNAARAGMLAAYIACGVAYAQTISLAPTGYITADLGGTRQFTATVTGVTNPILAWSAGGVAGGNTTVGTIDSTGLYHAPSAPSAAGAAIQIIVSVTNGETKLKASNYVYINAPGPKITSVTPNPLPVGQYTVTIQGSGFLAGATVMAGPVQLSTLSVTPGTVTANGYQGPGTSVTFMARNPGSSYSNSVVVPVTGATGGSGGGTGGGSGGGGGGGGTPAPVIAPASVTLALGATQQFSAQNTVTAWSATSGSVTSAGLYTAPAALPASGKDTVTATGPGGSSSATVTLVSNVPPVIQSISSSPLPLGVFSTTITGTGFTATSVAQLNGLSLAVTSQSATTLGVSGFAGAGGTLNLTVANGPVVSQPFPVPVGVANPMVSPSAARRFLEQAAFGPTPADAAHVQTIGFQAWLNEQFAMPQVSSYASLAGSSQGRMPNVFLANAVTNPDQLRQKVSFALSQIFVTSLNKIIWNGDMIPYQQMLMADAFGSYPQILSDVTLSPTMGNYLDMANNAKANPALGTVANENYAREIMQLMSIGTKMLNMDGTPVLVSGAQVPTYQQTDVTELARVFTGWTYAPKTPGGQVIWGAYINSSAPMVSYPAMHDFGQKNLINGYVSAANLSPQADLQGALANLAAHPNTAPFISKQLIQHLVKSSPSPAYVQRVATAFQQSNGDMKTVISAILLDTEARANDAGGADQITDGHLQEPALMLAAFVRAFNGQMTPQNYYASDMAALGQDIYNAPSVFNYYSPGYVVGSVGMNAPEFQIDNPNSAVLRENEVANLFNAYQNPIQSYGPGTTIDLSPFLPLTATPSTLVDALDLTLTHGTMPAAMKQIIVTAVTNEGGGTVRRVQTGIYLILTSSYYNVWH